MKTIKRFLSVLFVFTLIVFGSCFSTPVSQTDELDTAIRSASDYLNRNIPAGNKIVILNIQTESLDLADYVIDELIANAVNDRYFIVVDRHQLDSIRAEWDFQYSGDVDDESAQEIGRILGAQTIVSGAVSRLGSGYRLRLRALDVQTAQVQGQFNRNITSSLLINDIIASSSGTTSTTASNIRQPAPVSQTTSTAPVETTTTPDETTPSVTPTPSTPAAPVSGAQTYRIGDTGPAGGLIFYDKGNNSGGWRYLEAAPEEAESRARWSVHNTAVDNTRSVIGSGLRNTQLIVEKFAQTAGEWDTAAQYCNDLVFNGFNDWFLPSTDELDQMYGNLKRRNLGDFKNERYWSSTQANYYQSRVSADYQNFSNGQMEFINHKSVIYYVRPIRQVPGPN